MKLSTRGLLALSAAILVPVSGWAQDADEGEFPFDSDIERNLSVPDGEEVEGYDPDKPWSLEVELEYFNNNNTSDDEVEDEYSATISGRYYFNENISVTGVLLGAPVDGDGIFPDDYDFYFEELYAEYATDAFTLFGGKYNPIFGIGYDDAISFLYGAEYFFGYELVERLGVGGAYNFSDSAGGSHSVGASAFRLDTTALAKTFFKGIQLADRADGGLSNTSGLESYNVWLQGDDPFGYEDSRYNITYRSQKGGLPGEETETGFAIGASKLFSLPNGNAIEAYAEAVSLDNSLDDGIAFDQDSIMATAAYLFGDDWAASLGGGYQRIRNSSDVTGIANGNNNFVSVSIGKTFADSLYVELAHQRAVQDGARRNQTGIFLYYGLEF
ncbi:hypothetical protein [Ruegeria sp.]|uniref:hypothetical protein n=1 Tax=Ruegeria sp. TaxID=1879320 RepID=UPI00231AE3FB|nr:hypothetical protein [Ruegeria sp.]MDA7963482.1 hypothetical protein [Ruegeria sp.]